jgi:hypothetical protein
MIKKIKMADETVYTMFGVDFMWILGAILFLFFCFVVIKAIYKSKTLEDNDNSNATGKVYDERYDKPESRISILADREDNEDNPLEDYEDELKIIKKATDRELLEYLTLRKVADMEDVEELEEIIKRGGKDARF